MQSTFNDAENRISTGLDIVSGSLALAGSTLYWTQAGARSAPLP